MHTGHLLRLLVAFEAEEPVTEDDELWWVKDLERMGYLDQYETITEAGKQFIRDLELKLKDQ